MLYYICREFARALPPAGKAVAEENFTQIALALLGLAKQYIMCYYVAGLDLTALA
jgi:hypothetical protein